MLDPFPRAPATIARVEQPRYTAVAQALHWFTALLVLAVLPLAWVATSLPASPTKGFVFQLHKSVGITIFAIVALRILWRAWHPAPREAFVPPALALLGRINHWLLYLVFLLMPLSGFVLSAAAGNTTQYFFLSRSRPSWRRTRRWPTSPTRSISPASTRSTPGVAARARHRLAPDRAPRRPPRPDAAAPGRLTTGPARRRRDARPPLPCSNPDFTDPALPGRRFYCWHCALIEGVLAGFPTSRGGST